MLTTFTLQQYEVSIQAKVSLGFPNTKSAVDSDVIQDALEKMEADLAHRALQEYLETERREGTLYLYLLFNVHEISSDELGDVYIVRSERDKFLMDRVHVEKGDAALICSLPYEVNSVGYGMEHVGETE
jgi:hypothetical protein